MWEEGQVNIPAPVCSSLIVISMAPSLHILPLFHITKHQQLRNLFWGILYGCHITHLHYFSFLRRVILYLFSLYQGTLLAEKELIFVILHMVLVLYMQLKNRNSKTLWIYKEPNLKRTKSQSASYEQTNWTSRCQRTVGESQVLLSPCFVQPFSHLLTLTNLFHTLIPMDVWRVSNAGG